MAQTPNVAKTLLSAPLPDIIERLGLAIARAQSALDRNSMQVVAEMVDTTVELNGTEYNLLLLGFTPTFYAFTEAMVEARLDFSISETTEIGVEASAYAGTGIWGASVTATYARKFGIESKGSSSISAKLVALPAPEPLSRIIDSIIAEQQQSQ